MVISCGLAGPVLSTVVLIVPVPASLRQAAEFTADYEEIDWTFPIAHYDQDVHGSV